MEFFIQLISILIYLVVVKALILGFDFNFVSFKRSEVNE